MLYTERGERRKRQRETDRHTQRSCLWIVCVCVYFLLWIHCCKCTPIYMSIYYLTTLDEWLNLYLYDNSILFFKTTNFSTYVTDHIAISPII